MLIKVVTEGTRLFLPIPNILIFNGIVAKYASKHADDCLLIKPGMMRAIRRELRRAKRLHPDMALVDVVADGGKTKVKITY